MITLCKYLKAACFLFLISPFQGTAQEFGFNFKPAPTELTMKTYPRDTAAVAVVIREFGEAFIENDGSYNLLFQYHVRIKILSKEGLNYANVEVPLTRDGSKVEILRNIRASAFNAGTDGLMIESPLSPKSVYTEDHKTYDIVKFALPAVKEGSVIEYSYELESPFLFNFRPWEFQFDIPKLYSEYWAKIPGNYVYNITLRGPLKLARNESSIIKGCFTPNGQSADCVWYKYAMSDIPAFREDAYMTAKSNFVSRIHFELSEIKYFDGRVDKITREWNDVDDELMRHEDFGGQVKRARKLMSDVLAGISMPADPLQKAKAIYRQVANRIRWNELNSKYAMNGVKKAWESREGNVGDINLALVGAMQSAGFPANPVILSTRSNGSPVEVHPVMSEFNYVVASIVVGQDKYLLDATEPSIGFGLLPVRCLNGKGRMIDRPGQWVELRPIDKRGNTVSMKLSMASDGKITGEVRITRTGYEAAEFRADAIALGLKGRDPEQLARLWHMEVSGYQTLGFEDFDLPVVEKMNISMTEFGSAGPGIIYLDPFFAGKWEKNPFIAPERNYPVDFGAPMESVFTLTLELPPDVSLDEIPGNSALSMPGGGGRYLFNSSIVGSTLSITSRLQLTHTIYNVQEYHALRELFQRILEVEQSQVVLKKKG